MKSQVSELTDEQLVEQMAAGNVRAFGEFYDRMASTVLGLLLRVVPNRSEAEDILQEAFWQTWRTAGSYRPDRARPRTWIAMIARSRAIDHLRRRSADPVIGVDMPELQTEENVSAAAEHEECSAELRTALQRLPEEQRTSIRMSFYEGLTHHQIALQQGIPLGTVKTRIRLGMKRLKEIVGQTSEVA